VARVAKSISYHKEVFLRPENTLREVVETFSRTRLDAVPVVDVESRVQGIMTKHNLYRALLRGESLNSPIAGIFASPAVAVDGEQMFNDVYRYMQERELGQVVVTDADNRPIGMVTKMSVIESLHARSERMISELASLLDALENGVLAINRRGIITVFNPAAEKMLGVRAGDMLGREVTRVLPLVKVHEVLQDGSVQNWQRLPENPGILAKYLPVYRNGQINGAIAVMHDLTGYEKLARELESVKELQETLTTVLELAYDGLVVINQQGLITTSNRSINDFLGLEQDQILHRPVAEILPEIQLDEVLTTGSTDLGDVRSIRGARCIVTRLPMHRDGQVVGAVAKLTFKGLSRLPELVKRLQTLESQLSFYRDELSRVTRAGFSFEDIVGDSPPMRRVKAEARMSARSPSSILLLGESGTGKELFASAIHKESGRPGLFVKVNCAAMPDNLLESEFFGYEGGAFTGARKSGKPGKFELADRGTLFLDEIGDMSPQLQAKLLRVLQEREFERVGGIKTIRVEVRIIAATNRDLEEMMQRGEFREDLYYRLNVINLRAPPLRERREDIPLLAGHLIRKYNRIMGGRVTGLAPDTLEIFLKHAWPGNVRELENVIERALNMVSEGLIRPAHLPEYLWEQPVRVAQEVITAKKINLEENMASTEKDLIMLALAESGGNRTRAAQILGISRTNLYEKLRKYGIRSKQ
jgi:PAS domain S-box-containing protein